MPPALEATMAMFFIPHELHEIQPIFWIACVGSSIPSGLLAYALLWSQSSARFLTARERAQVIQRVRHATKGVIKQKKSKKYQFYEALTDPISWLFFLAAFCLQLANNLAFQQSLILLDLGVGNLGSTLITVASGGFAVAVAVAACVCLHLWPGYSAWWATAWVLPAIAGQHWDGRAPLASNHPAAYLPLARGDNMGDDAMFMIAYGISNIISPQMWKSGGPRYYGTWVAQTIVSFILTTDFLLTIRVILARRNKQRQAWIAEQAALGNFGDGFITTVDADGNPVQRKVDISVLDLTDLENTFFIYPL
ncbi:hypothetical protein BJY01DRAFT_249194 [Aspergillus pseudoustus]|uniref:Uncharacterized protein n=1 Tax=Aspergillus pseudoustus TaxID=1810923 RepID=A0ABR4JQ42_9EURO